MTTMSPDPQHTAPRVEDAAVVTAVRAGDEAAFGASPSATGASCTSTATGCSARSTRRRTSSRRRSCARGAGGRGSTPGPGWAVALPDRDERVPRRAAAPVAPRHDGRLVRRPPVAAAVPRPAARRGRPERGGARRRPRLARDDRARLPRPHPAPARAPARGRDPARRAGLVGEGDRGPARDERRVGELRAPARPRDARGARAAARRGPDHGRADRGGARAAGRVHRRARARRRGRGRRPGARGHPRDDAAVPDGLRRRRRDPAAGRAGR